MELAAGKITVPRGTWFYALIGLMAGFTTMIGNVAGPIFSVYLLAQRYEKKSLLGTSAWFFMLINLTKLPLQIFFWGNITARTAQIPQSDACGACEIARRSLTEPKCHWGLLPGFALGFFISYVADQLSP